MGNRLTTLAIHTKEKASILKQVLEAEGITAYLEEMDKDKSYINNGVYVRVDEENLSQALNIIEGNNLFNYSDKQTYKVDDGRKRILVAVDFSDYSLNACYVAFNIAKERGAKVKILHVMHYIHFPSTMPFADTIKTEGDNVLDRARKNILKLCCEIDNKIAAGEFPSINYSYSIREGIVEEEIDDFIKEYKPNLVVIGTKGKDKNEANVFGNVTANIIEMSNVPILAVPKCSPMKGLNDAKQITFLTNLSIPDLKLFDVFLNTMNPEKHNLEITLLHVELEKDKGTEAKLTKVNEYFIDKYPELKVQTKLIKAKSVFDGVNQFINNSANVNMIVMNTRKRNIFTRILFSPSISRKILPESDIALLVLRG